MSLFDLRVYLYAGVFAAHLAMPSWAGISCGKNSLPIDNIDTKQDASITQAYLDNDLFEAARLGMVEQVQSLLEAGASPDATMNSITVLTMTTFKGHLEVTAALIAAKANVECISTTGLRPLHQAAYEGHIPIVRLLLDSKAQLEAKTAGLARTPLISAVAAAKYEVVNVLIQAKANLEALDDFGDTALANAAYYGHLEIAKLLLNAKANIQVYNFEGRSPLYWAIKQDMRAMVKFLSYLSFDTVNLQDLINCALKMGDAGMVTRFYKIKSERLKQRLIAFINNCFEPLRMPSFPASVLVLIQVYWIDEEEISQAEILPEIPVI